MSTKDPGYHQTEEDDEEADASPSDVQPAEVYRWSPSGVWWRDLFHFVGPGWFVCIAYIDPGNYQADIQSGGVARYNLLWTLWWTSILSIYVQILCVRLAVYGQETLAELQARDCSDGMRYLNWAIAEFSTVVTDLPSVIGVGVAGNVFFGWPYYVGVILSLFTTMVFLATMSRGIRVLEVILVVFIGIMSIALWVEMSLVGVSSKELIEGWVYGFVRVTSDDIFSITGILGAVVMPHNLYLHTAAVQSRRVVREESVVRKAVQLSSLDPVLPILMSFFINMAVVAISAESVFGSEGAEDVGLTDFCHYFQYLNGGCILWGIALLAAGQSGAITTTFTGQYVMDGFLSISLPVWARAITTRLVAITPCIIVSILFPDDLNALVNFVNSALSFLLPFALTPLVKFTTSEVYLGRFAPPKWEQYLLKSAAFAVYFLNAIALSAPGGGMFGFIFEEEMSGKNVFLFVLMMLLQVFYFWWNANCMLTPITAQMRPLEEERVEDGEFATAQPVGFMKEDAGEFMLTGFMS